MTSGSEAPTAGLDLAASAGPLPERALPSVRSRDRALLVSVAVTIGIGALLIAAITRDPAAGVTWSGSPFSDEGFNALNARNLVLLGRWSTDGWNLYLVNLPFSVALAAVFQAFGTGIVQARAATIAMVVLTVGLLAVGLRRPFGPWPAIIAAVAYGTSTLVLYYGRLVYLEDLVVLGLVAGTLTLVRSDRRPVAWGVLGGSAFAIAIGTKPSAAFAVLGLLLSVALAEGLVSSPARRWLASAALTVAAFGVAWVVLIWLPQRDAVVADLRIWAPITWPHDLAAAAARITAYVEGPDGDGAILASLPLLVLALVGFVASASALGRALRPDQRRLIAAAMGWFVAGMLVLLVASYRPNRYVIPLLPALTILGAAGIALVGRALARRLPARALAAGGLVLAGAVAAPGLAAHLSWVSGTGSTLPASQAELASLVPPGATVVGEDAPTLLMPTPVVTIVARRGVAGNSGDLYSSAGVRWYLVPQGAAPAIVTVPARVWAVRHEVACVPWAARSVCLYEVP